MLTTREFEVLQLVSRGMSTREIAAKLNISTYTVDEYRGKLLVKFAARNSVELVGKAVESNFISYAKRGPLSSGDRKEDAHDGLRPSKPNIKHDQTKTNEI